MIYVKRKSTSLLLALASLSVVSSSLVSCSESVGMSGITLSDKKISFTATEVNGWTPNSSSSNDESTRTMSIVGSYHPLIVKSDLGKPLYLHPVEQMGTYFYNDKDELVTRSGVPLSEINNQNSISTRGTKVTEIGDEIFVSAISKKDNVEAGYFSFEKAKRNGDIWHILNDKYWATDASLSFYAYAPTNVSMLSTSDSGLSGYRTVHYVAGTGDDIKSQPDFIVAKSEDNQRSSTDVVSAVDLHFSHALTAITFAVGKDMVPGKISKITVRGVKGEGDYNIATNTWNTDNVTANAEYTIDNLGPNGDGTITGEKDVALTNNDQTLLMIPQSLGSNAEVEIVFDNDNGPQTLTASLSGTSWTAGHSIIYKLSASEVTTLSMGNIEFPTNWSSQYTTTANKLKSAYANGNQVGLFIVDDNNKLRNANVVVTYNSTSNTWSIPADKTCLFSPRFQYFAYYPYQEALTGMPAEGSTITISGNTKEEMATNFFSTAIDNWQPTSDQSDLDKLDKCDLQIGMANLSNTASSIDFNTMIHAMGLADITLGEGLKYELSDKTYDWTSAIVSDKFVDNLPCELSYNRYVAIVKPNTSITFNAIAKGWKGAWKNALSFQPKINEIEKQTAMREDDEKHSYTLALGDMYYKDGAITHNEDDLEPIEVNTPIGIVSYIAKGDGSDDYWVEKDTQTKGIGGHALVMGLMTIGSTGTTNPGKLLKWCTFTGATSPSHTKMNSAADIRKSSDQVHGSGYKMTSDFWNNASYPAFTEVKNYKIPETLKNKSTDWFIPTVGQWYAVFDQFGNGVTPTDWNFDKNTILTNSSIFTAKINKALSKAGTNKYTDFFQNPVKLYNLGYWEWTSSERGTAQTINLRAGYFYSSGKVGTVVFTVNSAQNRYLYPMPVRPFLAF